MATTLAAQQYQFTGGYPTPETAQQAYDDLDLIRAMQMYRVFYPTVSGRGHPQRPEQSAFDRSWKPSDFEAA